VPVVAHVGRQPVIGVGAVALLADQPGVLEQPEMTRDAGLGQAEDAGELGDVEAVRRQHAQEPEARLVAEEAEERRRVLHIHKST
jgi:hypothetical protein